MLVARGKVWYGDERADVEELEDWIGCDESIFSFPQFLGYDGTLPTSYYDGSDLAMMLAPPMAYGWPTGKKLVFAQDRKMVDDKELAWGWREGRLLSSFFFASFSRLFLFCDSGTLIFLHLLKEGA